MSEQPSWKTSTTSQILLATVILFSLAAWWVIFKGKPETGLAAMGDLLEAVLLIYGIRKGSEIVQNGKPPEVKP